MKAFQIKVILEKKFQSFTSGLYLQHQITEQQGQQPGVGYSAVILYRLEKAWLENRAKRDEILGMTPNEYVAPYVQGVWIIYYCVPPD